MDKKQLVINQFLALQNSLIKRQEHQTRKINAKRALIKFLMPDISIYSNHNNYKQKYKAIPNKSLQEYSIDDIRFENADFILESMALDQFLKNRIILTIHSTYQNNKSSSCQILHSELKLDVYGIYDIKKIHNQIIAKCTNDHHHYQLPFLIEDNGKHSVNFLENTITDENWNILYKITNQNLMGGSYKETNYNDTYDDEYHIRFNVFGNLDLAQTKFEKGILEYEGMQSNKELTIIVSEKYQDFMKQFNIDDYLIRIELDNLSQATSNEVNMRLSYIDFFYMDRCLRYNLDKNKIEYKTLKPELQLYSMKKQKKMHKYRAIFDVKQYIDSNRYDKFEMYSNIFTLEEICDSLVKLDLDKREGAAQGVAIAIGETIGVTQDNHNEQYNDKKNTIKKLLFKNLMKPKEITFKELVRKIQRSRQYTDSQLNTYKEIVSNNLFDGNTNNGTNAFSNHEFEQIEKFILMNSIEPLDFNENEIHIPYLEQFGHVKCLSNVKYINKLLLSKYNKKARRLFKRLKTFKNYVLMFNPEIKDFYYSGLLMGNSYTGDDKEIDNHFNYVFNAIRVIQKDYPNLITNIMKYRKENAGLFPLIIHAKVKNINEGKTDLLSYENVVNKYLFGSKHQFKQLNKKKSPTLTKLYSCLLNYIYNYNHNQNWHYKIISNVDAMYDECFKDSDNDYQEARKNILIDLFWKLIANKTLSIREIYAIIMEFGNVIYSSRSYGANAANGGEAYGATNADNVEEILFHKNKEYLYNIITDYCYQQAVMAFESNKNKNKIDKRSSVEVITRNNQIISTTIRDLNIFTDFIKKIKKAPLSIQQMQEYINQSKWKNKLDFINHYDESVALCLSKVDKKDYLINLIRKDNPKFIIPTHSQLKLDKKSTINTVKKYIEDYDKFYLLQQQIIDGGIKEYQYPIDIQEMNINSIQITPILDSYELMEEGHHMVHCGYSFHEHCLRNKYIIFKITDNTKYEDMTDVIKRLTLGIMIRLPDNNRYSDKDYINCDKRSDRDEVHNNQNLAIKPTYNDLYFRFSQCYGYKNRFIRNNEQQAKINITINRLIYQLNKQLIEKFDSEKLVIGRDSVSKVAA